MIKINKNVIDIDDIVKFENKILFFFDEIEQKKKIEFFRQKVLSISIAFDILTQLTCV